MSAVHHYLLTIIVITCIWIIITPVPKSFTIRVHMFVCDNCYVWVNHQINFVHIGPRKPSLTTDGKFPNNIYHEGGCWVSINCSTQQIIPTHTPKKHSLKSRLCHTYIRTFLMFHSLTLYIYSSSFPPNIVFTISTIYDQNWCLCIQDRSLLLHSPSMKSLSFNFIND